MIDNLIPYHLPSSYSAFGFFFRCTFIGKLLLANSTKATVEENLFLVK
jgi:hypothetical protein